MPPKDATKKKRMPQKKKRCRQRCHKKPKFSRAEQAQVQISLLTFFFPFFFTSFFFFAQQKSRKFRKKIFLKPEKKSRSKIGNKTYIKKFFFAKKVCGIHKYSTKKFWMPEKFFGFHKTERCHFWCQHLMVMVNSRPVFIAAQCGKRFSAHSQGPMRLLQIVDP